MTGSTSQPTEAEAIALFDTLSNWGRWGPDDELGTLNFITPEVRQRAASLVREGRTVSCARPITSDVTHDGRVPFTHFMISSGDASPATGPGTASDWIAFRFHGQTMTHLDALSHYHWNGHTYNGRPTNLVGTARGAEVLSVEAAASGIITRGVLLDVPRALGVPFIPHGQPITPADLERCERSTGVTVESGDLVMVSTGRDRRDYDQSIGWTGLSVECLGWLRDREVSVLCGDTTHDIKPSIYPTLRSPIHNIAIAAMGLWLIDNVAMDELGGVCSELGRWSFFCCALPLVMERTTGSPVNPVALF